MKRSAGRQIERIAVFGADEEHAVSRVAEASKRQADCVRHERDRLRSVVLRLIGRKRRAFGAIDGELGPGLGVAPG